jgi:UDP-N-acetylglucosamine diphosphorylase/glucosamine-1-phosphate N-acetyltransferase
MLGLFLCPSPYLCLMRLEFFDDHHILDLAPLCSTRPAAELRVGIYRIWEKWMHELQGSQHSFFTREYLQGRYPSNAQADVRINGRLLPDPQLVAAVQALKPGETLVQDELILAARMGSEASVSLSYEQELTQVSRPFDVFLLNGVEIKRDFQHISANRPSAPLDSSVTHWGQFPVFMEEGAQVKGCTLNSSEGPIYIGKNAEIMEGSLVRGPLALCEGAKLKMGTKAYGSTTLGPYSVAGGEISNVVFQAYSNKGHDGFLGNAAIGEWCNLGADTNASNLKNNYDDVKVWNYSSGRFEKSGQQFVGLIMGDHSKAGINTMFNTGTVVGVACNVFGSGFPRQFIPDFAWGGSSGFVTHKLDAALKTASLVMPRRGRHCDQDETSILETLHQWSQPLRSWEKEG